MTGFGKYECDDLASTLKERDHKDATDLVITIPIHGQAMRSTGGGTGRDGDGLGNGLGIGRDGDPAPTLRTGDNHGVFHNGIIRKFTPRERERLQGFKDDWTLVDGVGEHARYQMTGNTMTTQLMRWVGERIEMVSRI